MDTSYSFTRDPEVEHAAVNALGIAPEQVLRMRIDDVRALVEDFIRSHSGVEDFAQRQSLEFQQDHAEPTRPKTPLLAPAHRNTMADSELHMAYGDNVFQLSEDPTPGIQQAMAMIAEDDEDVKDMRLLTMPINVNEWCRAKEGLVRLNDHVHKVLRIANELEESIQEKTRIMAMNRTVLDEEDVQWIQDTTTTDSKQLTVIIKWLRAIISDLNQVIQQRLQVQTSLKRSRNSAMLCDKMHKKTLAMRSIHTAISARCDCMQVPLLTNNEESE